MNATTNTAIITGQLGRVGALILGAVALFSLAAAAQTAKEIKGATPLVAIPNEAPPRLVVDPPTHKLIAGASQLVEFTIPQK